MPRIAIKGLVVSAFDLLLTFLCSLTLTPIPKLALTPLPNDALLANLNRWVDSAAQVFSACWSHVVDGYGWIATEHVMLSVLCTDTVEFSSSAELVWYVEV